MPLKIKTNKYVKGQKYDGIKEFTLHNSYDDPAILREKLTYDLLGELGLYSLRTAFAKVYINDQYWGLYTIVEAKDELFRHRLDNKDADAIESLDFGNMCYLGPNPDDYNYDISYLPYYVIDNGEEKTAFPRFVSMIDKANNTADANYVTEVSKELNLADFFKYQAANVYLMNFDSYIGFLGNQIYMYDEAEQIWQVLPWDFNASLNLWDNGNGNQLASAYPLFPDAITNGCIAGKLNTVPELKTYYLDAMCQLAYKISDTVKINALINRYKNQIGDAVANDWRKVFSTADFNQMTEYGYFTSGFNQFEGLKTFFKERHELIAQSLATEGYTCTFSSITTPSTFDVAVKLFPNPTSDLLNIEDAESVEKIIFYDNLGRTIQTVKSPQFPISIANFKSGLYHAMIITDKGENWQKLIKN